MPAVIAAPMTASDWTGVVIVLVAGALGLFLANGLGPDCHPECREAWKASHKLARVRVRDAEIRRQHDDFHELTPNKRCPHCQNVRP